MHARGRLVDQGSAKRALLLPAFRSPRRPCMMAHDTGGGRLQAARMNAMARPRGSTACAGGGHLGRAVTWGSTPEERRMPYPCDRHVSGPEAAYFRAVDVQAPAAIVFRWLCQLRVAPYSYDCIDNLGRRSPRRLTPGLDRLAVGQPFMTGFELIDFEGDRHLTLVARPSFASVFGLEALAVTYLVRPRATAESRLVVKLLVRHVPGL